MTGQIIFTVAAGKQLMAQAIFQLPEVQTALRTGRIVLKSGTTISALGELCGVPPMRIGGRLAPDGARGAKTMVTAPHLVVLEQGKWRCIDNELVAVMETMGPGDLFITGANALDMHGTAGLLAGMEHGSQTGRALATLWSEGIDTIIAVGREKLIPGAITDLCQQAGRRRIEKSMGMAVGLLPIYGKVITEKEAIELLTGVAATIIAGGGLCGAEGATLMLVEGTTEQVDRALELAIGLCGASVSGDPTSMIACGRGGSVCQSHFGCIYKLGN